MIKTERKSGIELLKILAMLLLVIFHVINTLERGDNIVQLTSVINFNLASTDINQNILAIIVNFVNVCNTVFIASSAWFLVENNKVNKQKVMKLLLLNFIIAIIWLIITKSLGYRIYTEDLFYSLLPTTLNANWFITGYILLYIIHGYLNVIIEKMSKKTHFELCMFILVFYYIINFVADVFYYTKFTVFISVYFIVAYIKKYCKSFYENKKLNIIIVLIGVAEIVLYTLVINYLGLRYEFFSDKKIFIVSNTRFYCLFVGIGLFNLFNKLKFNSKFINKISSLTFLIYIIHENIFVRYAYRPVIWNYIYKTIGYDHVVLVAILFGVLLFIISTIVAYIFDKCAGKYIDKLSVSSLNLITKTVNKLYEKIS